MGFFHPDALWFATPVHALVWTALLCHSSWNEAMGDQTEQYCEPEQNFISLPFRWYST